jgi:hypothetical protein
MQKIKTVADMLTMLLPPLLAQLELESPGVANMPLVDPRQHGVVKSFAQDWRRREVLGEAVNGAHAAHAEAGNGLCGPTRNGRSGYYF